ncbi:hypothetical protein QFC21_000895 [Naganishia friedmannii]|uniref:Uncharacterized protein n=1 Tax=Naganishia friedmannii TaxID=89922 RepID=A0ACC2W8L5_9TREE|nr:hypothetical protein QFC21_000895 [Naganishia friedmannii]
MQDHTQTTLSMRSRSVVLSTCISWIIRLLTDSKYYWHLFSLVFVGEVLLCALVMRYVAYTNIDYLAYSQQATLFLPPNNIRDYSSLQGDTGPLVYPALHLYIYSLLHKRFPAASSPGVGGFVPGKSGGLEAGTAVRSDGRSSLLALQGMWAGVYLATLFAVAWIYRQAILSLEKQAAAAQKKETQSERSHQTISVGQSVLKLLFGTSPPLQPFLLFLPLSKRLHSIYVLRLFNDPLAMLALYASIVLFVKRKWYIGAIGYSTKGCAVPSL